MEKVVQPYDKERMRMAMLKHEETFRQQVYELHRLYKIQKMLMDQQQIRPNQERINTNAECNNRSMIMEDDHESDQLELTLSLGPSRRRKTDKSESGQSTVSSSSTGSTQTRKTSPKDNSSGLAREDHQFIMWGTGGGNFPQGSGSEPGFPNGQQSSSHPAWLFQALSLKLT